LLVGVVAEEELIGAAAVAAQADYLQQLATP
jgi:hypothetical protein